MTAIESAHLVVQVTKQRIWELKANVKPNPKLHEQILDLLIEEAEKLRALGFMVNDREEIVPATNAVQRNAAMMLSRLGRLTAIAPLVTPRS